ncbi:MAG: putative phosphoribosyl transferase [Streptosporangiaceae bacterium]|nr:putative phosphoribosyl transferase [Streptosporangiaceae bacterium]
MPFLDRADAGRRLAGQLMIERGPGTVVLGLPRGGIPVAYEIARALDAPLDVILVRKIGLPAQPELAMGAIGEDGVRVVNDDVVQAEHVSDREFAGVEEAERAELGRRAERYRAGHPRLPLTGKTAIVVDDGIATGSTARAACQVARAHGAARVVLAVPVAPQASIDALASMADEVVAAEVPEPFLAIGQWYRDFAQTGDAEVVELLRQSAKAHGDGDAAAPVPPPVPLTPAAADRDVIVMAGPVPLPGRLTVPAGARGVVVFAHGSGSSRSSPRNMFVAGALHVVGLGSLLFDLLTPEEEADRANVFDIGLLASRLSAATTWLRAQPGLQEARVGYFGASTGAAAALRAAAGPGSGIAAVVSRGGRPDLAGAALGAVRAPALFLVGALDDRVLELNEAARAQMRGESRLVVIPGAGHLFAEPGTLEQVASLARDWFVRYLRADPPG